MNATIEDMYQQIGQLALEAADDLAGKWLIYAEVQAGVISTDLFYINTAGNVRYQFGSKQLKDSVYAFWENWKHVPDNKEWRTMSYIVDDGKFTVDFLYPDQVKANRGLASRRPAVIAKHFGSIAVDYSNPNNIQQIRGYNESYDR